MPTSANKAHGGQHSPRGPQGTTGTTETTGDHGGPRGPRGDHGGPRGIMGTTVTTGDHGGPRGTTRDHGDHGDHACATLLEGPTRKLLLYQHRQDPSSCASLRKNDNKPIRKKRAWTTQIKRPLIHI